MFDKLSITAVEAELVTTAGHLAAGTCRFLRLLAEFDDRDGWSGPGLRSCAHWLNWRVGMNLRTARDHLRVAHALRELPATTAAFAAGRVSYSKVRALTRIATPDTEAGLLTIALHGTTSQLESLVTAARARVDPRPAAARRGLRCSTAADGSLLVSLRIPAERGEQFLATIEAHLAEHDTDTTADTTTDTDAETVESAADGSAEPPLPAVQGDPVDAAEQNRIFWAEQTARDDALRTAGLEHAPGAVVDPAAARRLDALLELLTCATVARPTRLVVHLRLDERDRPETAWIDGGPAIPLPTAERLTCTAAVQALLVDRDGNPLFLGRARRTASPAQLMALRVRDGDHCTFPGCSNTRHLDAHHLRWWRHDGPTDLENLTLLCGFHHTVIHDHGYHATQTPTGLEFHRPDGTRITPAGPPTSGDADDLVASHTTDQLHINDWTITPNWGGEPLDRDTALQWLLPQLATAA